MLVSPNLTSFPSKDQRVCACVRVCECVCVCVCACVCVSSLTEQKELVLPSGVPLVPAELSLNLIVDPASLFGLRAEAASPDRAQSHSSWITRPPPGHTHIHNVGYRGRRRRRRRKKTPSILKSIYFH